jgi:hypothetical protein
MEKEVTSTEIAPALPNRLTLSQNYPNPFNPSTTLSFELPTRGYVQLSVFNLLGQHLADLVARELEAGVHTATFDGRGLSSGTYIYRVHANGQTISKKLVLMK